EQAESLLLAPYQQLIVAGHPQAALAAITMARINWMCQRPAIAYLEQAMAVIQETQFLGLAPKARLFEKVVECLMRDGRSEPAERFRSSAQQYWQRLGVTRACRETAWGGNEPANARAFIQR